MKEQLGWMLFYENIMANTIGNSCSLERAPDLLLQPDNWCRRLQAFNKKVSDQQSVFYGQIR